MIGQQLSKRSPRTAKQLSILLKDMPYVLFYSHLLKEVFYIALISRLELYTKGIT
jgi:hypothetical protein